jgi:hypothetical protein
VENFFKEKTVPAEGILPPVIDNILVKLENLQLCRAVMTLAGSLEVQVCRFISENNMKGYKNLNF